MEEKSIKSFIGMYPKSNTKRNYRSAIYDFLDFFNGGRVRAGKQISEDEKPKYEELCQRYFSEKRDYIGDLIAFAGGMNGKAPATINLKMAVVREWFEYNGVELTQREIKTLRHKLPSAKGSWTVERDFDKELLKKVIAHTDEKGTTLILTLASSGMRIGEALHIKLNDVDLSQEPPAIIVRGEYTKGSGTRVVFISKEAKAAVEEWLKVRESYILSSLNRNKGLVEKAEAKPKKESDDRLFPFSYAVVRELWGRALKKAGLFEKDNATGRLQYRVHGLRKFFRSQLALSCPVDIVEAILGHEGYLTGAYRRYTQKQMGEFYLKAEHYVTIRGSGNIQEIQDRMQDAEMTIEGYKSIITKQAEEMARLREEVGGTDQELQTLKNDIEKLQPLITSMKRIGADPKLKGIMIRKEGDNYKIIEGLEVEAKKK